jgi:ribosomal protein L44E
MRSMNELSYVPGKMSTINRRKAIRLRCLDCVADNTAEVRRCAFKDCSLYPFRSGSGHQVPADRDKAIRHFCLWCMNGQVHEVRLCPSGDCPLFQFRLRADSKAIRTAKKSHIDGRQAVKMRRVIPEVGGGSADDLLV